MKNLVIVGVGEIAAIAYEYFLYDSDYRIVAFSASNDYLKKSTFKNLKVVPLDKIKNKFPPNENNIFVAMGNSRLNYDRYHIYNIVKSLGYQCASYISSRAFVWDNVEIGENCFILENNVLQPYTKVGNNVTLWSGNHIGHRTVIEDNCFITSHVMISGMCKISQNVFIGGNSSIANNVTIEKDNFIAMGSVINKSTVMDSVYKGNPAKRASVTAKMFCGV